jgi:hypothetical protein
LAEKDKSSSVTTSDVPLAVRDALEAGRRRTLETVSGTLSEEDVPYQYEAYPLILRDNTLTHRSVNPDFVAGGGDNPLLHGGLAMAVFAMEDLMGLNPHSFKYATLLLDFFLASEGLTVRDEPSGFMFRRRNWWYEKSKAASKDEMCGFLLGLMLYVRAAATRNDETNCNRAKSLLRRFGNFQKNIDWKDAFPFQFPFGRALKNATDKTYEGNTFPEGWSPAIDTAVGVLVQILTGTIDLLDPKYHPWELYRDSMYFQKEAYEWGSAANDWTSFKVDLNFFNITMYFHTMLIVLLHWDLLRKKQIWCKFCDFFDYFCISESFFSPGDGEARQNVYFGAVTKCYINIMREVGEEVPDGMENAVAQMIAPLSDPSHAFYFNLPLTSLKTIGNMPFNDEDSGKWGENFTWEHRDANGHTFSWDVANAGREIGPTQGNDENHIDYHARVKSMLAPGYYMVDPSKGLRVEGGGLDYLFPRMLLAYLEILPAPDIANEPEYFPMPLDGPFPEGSMLANTHTHEVHIYGAVTERCEIDKMKPEHMIWFPSLQEAHHAGYDDCFYCIGGSSKH